MATKSPAGWKIGDRDRYLELVREFPLCSVRSDSQLAAAQRMIDRLMSVEPLGNGALAYLDALSDLVAVYEEEHHPIPPASDADMLRHLLDSQGLSSARLSAETGIARSSISEVLAGKKRFSRGMIRKLADFFRVDVSVLTGNL